VYGPGRKIGVTADPDARGARRRRTQVLRFTGATGMDYAEDVGTIFARAATAWAPDGAHAFSLQGQLATMDDVLAAIHAGVPDADVRAKGPELMFAAQLDEEPLYALLPYMQRTPLIAGTRETIAFYRSR
jgi:UDP-glucose 4-epimerase